MMGDAMDFGVEFEFFVDVDAQTPEVGVFPIFETEFTDFF
jgi:hypothetical protein